MRKKKPIKEPGEAAARNAGGHAAAVRRLLLSAYDTWKRSLPWRGETDPYRIWVSEVMLQQTRVETIIPYYEKWLERFPDIDTLAEAEEDDVLRVWQGLGYYSRARRLQEGARVVRELHGGSLPGTKEALRSLPGVGDYTAGAVASIAFGEAVPAVDGNAKRVLSRMFDLPDPSPRALRTLAAELLDPQRPGDFNQALMELGALVCVPRSPRCDGCPLEPECLARKRGTVQERPLPKRKKAVPEIDEVVLVVAARNGEGGFRLLLRKRPSEGLLAGMWEFPGVEADAVAPEMRRSAGPYPSAPARTDDSFRVSALALASRLGLCGGSTEGTPSNPVVRPLDVVTHVFSHLKARYRPFLLVLEETSKDGSEPGCLPSVGGLPVVNGCVWVPLEGLDRVPIPVAQGRIADAALSSLAR
jgi:A/G-specific adenine glycosylase